MTLCISAGNRESSGRAPEGPLVWSHEDSGRQFQAQEVQSLSSRALRKDMEAGGLECRKRRCPQGQGRSPSPPASSNSRDPCKARASLRSSVGIRRFSARGTQGQ